MTSSLLQNGLRAGASAMDYYDYDYGGNNARFSANQRLKLVNARLGRVGLGNGLYGANSNTYGQYAGAGGYDYDYSSGYNSGNSGYSGYSSNSYSPAASKSSYGSYSGGYNDCPGIPIALLLVTLLGIGVMGFILFTKIQGAGRRKRDIIDSWVEMLPQLEDLDRIILHGRSGGFNIKCSFFTRDMSPWASNFMHKAFINCWGKHFQLFLEKF